MFFFFVSVHGHYTYIEASYPRQPSDKARLVSPKIKSINSMCLRFWYHMYGEHIRTLNIYIRHSKRKETILWSRTGTLDRKWYAGKVNFYSVSSTQIIFEGIRGKGYRGDIALDDIRLTNGACPGELVFLKERKKERKWLFQAEGRENGRKKEGNSSWYTKERKKDK